ncbi:hypothetical protein D6817_02775 [Candidatus Pacearchaeota archaeon]|nr:MAG: hypothetical protein D6817_02775 [Candidatus Pacearchaeota archaeon]
MSEKKQSGTDEKEQTPSALDESVSASYKSQLPQMPSLQKPSPELEEKKKQLEKLKDSILAKFPFVKAMGIVPPNFAQLFDEEEVPREFAKEVAEKKPDHLVLLIPEDEYKNINKIEREVVQIVRDSGENIWVHIKSIEVDLWTYGLDSRFEFLDAIALSFPLHDTGILGSLRVAVIHKNLVLNWLNRGRAKYVATYAIGGSLVRGTADKTSDVDTFVIIDDTDVKRMSAIELREKLRAKIHDYIREATALAGVGNVLNVQVYLLTDFWQAVKDAQPIIFTFIRDGIPLYDRGTFIPWKRLLKLGKIKPSPEAIELFMKEGDRTNDIVTRKLLDTMVEIYFGVVTPTQALMMLAGHAPPVPKTIVSEVKKVLVEEEKVMSEKELKTLEKAVKYYKDYEHGKLKSITGKEIDELWSEAKDYFVRLKEIRKKLESKLQKERTKQIREEVFSLLEKMFGKKSEKELVAEFEKEVVEKGKLPERLLDTLKSVAELSSKGKKEELSQLDVERLTRDAFELVRAITEYLQRRDVLKLERGLMRIKHNDENYELVITPRTTFLISQSGEIKKIEGEKLTQSSKSELEEAMSEKLGNKELYAKDDVLEALKKALGSFEIVL